MITAVAFAVAAAVGALARAEAGRRWNRHEGLAVGTIVVNATGSFLLGLSSELTPPALTILGVGGLGAYTTFSSAGGGRRSTRPPLSTTISPLAAGSPIS